MSRYFHAAPFAPHDSTPVYHERTALDASNLFAIHVFHLDHVESVQALSSRREQLEREAHFGFEASCDFRLSREMP